METKVSDCVFCTRDGNTPALFETASLYAIPDKYPLAPGHTLIISKNHLACYGAAPVDVLRDLDEAASLVRGFLRDAYGLPVLSGENGVYGQSVYHAHLHLIPLPVTALSPELADYPGVARIAGWASVRDRYARDGVYTYLRVGDDEWLLPANNDLRVRRNNWLAAVSGLRRGPNGWMASTTPDDVNELGRRWVAWADDHRPWTMR